MPSNTTFSFRNVGINIRLDAAVFIKLALLINFIQTASLFVSES